MLETVTKQSLFLYFTLPDVTFSAFPPSNICKCMIGVLFVHILRRFREYMI